MIPGMNPKMMKQAMRRLGIKSEEIEATEVLIKTAEKEIVILNPAVAKVNVMGQDSFQISGGDVQERGLSSEPDINEDDVKTVMEQASVSEEEAKEAISKAEGDLAKAIMDLKG